ncbi:MAG: hypothetical protein EHM42_09960 [Planctomycetaceae bacterium]|nr:MAG: hypothetical protein EHM42_09960 [Planctomycetaceae bacterium]
MPSSETALRDESNPSRSRAAIAPIPPEGDRGATLGRGAESLEFERSGMIIQPGARAPRPWWQTWWLVALVMLLALAIMASRIVSQSSA